MKFATIERDRRPVPALWTDNGVWDLQAALALAPRDAGQVFDTTRPLTLIDVIAAGAPGLAFARAIVAAPDAYATARLPGSGVARLLAPIPRPPKNVFCLGRNYAEHIREDNTSRDQDTALPEHPQFFTKPWTAIVGDGAGIRYDEKVTRRLDYEVELAVVIGKGGRDITEAHAMEHVFGYTIVNDVTARDLQKRHDQWFKGKGLDTFCPMGPWIVTADEVGDPHALRIELDVNGQRRQGASTGDMIFTIAQQIASLSAGLTLEPGDVIATGTPSGVGYAMNPRQWLKAGDEIVCRVERIGTLRNRVVAAA